MLIMYQACAVLAGDKPRSDPEVLSVIIQREKWLIFTLW